MCYDTKSVSTCLIPRSTPFAAPVPSGHLVTAATSGDMVIVTPKAKAKGKAKAKAKANGVPKAKSAVQEATQVFGL